MNAENLLRVADAIEKHEVEWLGFNMARYVGKADDVFHDMSGHGCGTTACIAGWACVVERDLKRLTVATGANAYEHGADFFGLTLDEADDLFRCGPSHTQFHKVTPTQAVRTLRHAAEHGVIDWDAANPPAFPA